MLTMAVAFFANMISEATFLVMFTVSSHLKIDKKKIIIVASVLALCALFLADPINGFCRYLSHELNLSNVLFINFFNALMNFPVLYYFDSKHVKRNIFYGACCYYIWQSIVFLESGILLLLAPDIAESPFYANLFLLLLSYLFYKGTMFLVKKIKPYEFAQYLGIDNRPFWQVCLIGIGILCSSFFIDMLHFTGGNGTLYYLLMAVLLILLSIVVFRITSDYVHYQETETLHDLVVSQQTMYIQNLEDIQQDMRMFKHDYLNMLSGFYLQAKHGDVAEIQETLKTLLNEFDEDIGQKMNITNQLSNLKIMELKCLIIKKLTKIHQKKINFILEVLYPVNRIGIKTQDLIRCLGILLDNAIEEVDETNGRITLSILQGNDLTIVVENSVHHAMEIEHIWQDGYSTKGPDRGLGLSSYQKIISQYNQVTTATIYENKILIQELRIGVNG